MVPQDEQIKGLKDRMQTALGSVGGLNKTAEAINKALTVEDGT